MLSEEALVFVLALAGCALVTLGALELVWPTRPKHPLRRSAAARDLWRRRASRPSVAARTALPEVLEPAAIGERLPRFEERLPARRDRLPLLDDQLWLLEERLPRLERSLPLLEERLSLDESPVAVVDEQLSLVEDPAFCEHAIALEEFAAARAAESAGQPALAARDVTVMEPPPAPADVRPGRPRKPRGRAVPQETANDQETADDDTAETPVFDRCRALLEAARFEEAARLAKAALDAGKAARSLVPSPAVAAETAQLWGLVGLARQGVDDVDAARFAFEEAIAVAAGGERSTWERHLGALALRVGLSRLHGSAGGGVADDGVAESIRSAIDWLERGLAVAPGDEGLRRARHDAADALWLHRERAIGTLLARSDYPAARRVLDEVMTDLECPPGRRQAFAELWNRTVGDETDG